MITMIRVLLAMGVLVMLFCTYVYSATGHPWFALMFFIVAVDLTLTAVYKPLFKPGRFAQWAFHARKDDGIL